MKYEYVEDYTSKIKFPLATLNVKLLLFVSYFYFIKH
jgi:hypothetical protein